MTRVLILRPQPGADETAARARALGLDPVVAPLFTVRPVTWNAPDPAAFDAVMMTSANAARYAGPQLQAFLQLPCYAVGDASAASARKAGFAEVRTGHADVAALVTLMQSDGIRSALHLAGEDRAEPGPTDVMIAKQIVYASVEAEQLPAVAEQALSQGALVLLHSPRAAAAFSRLCGRNRAGIALAAISEAATLAAGPGWRATAWPDQPRDQALLEVAVRLCKTATPRGEEGNAHGL